jgi:hypothetical protein
MKRKELMAIVALAAGLSGAVSTTTHAYAGNGNKPGVENEQDHPGHFIGQGHFRHGNGHGYGHNHHDHDIY